MEVRLAKTWLSVICSCPPVLSQETITACGQPAGIAVHKQDLVVPEPSRLSCKQHHWRSILVTLSRVHVQISFFLYIHHSPFHHSELREGCFRAYTERAELLGFVCIPCLEDQAVADLSTGPVRNHLEN